MVKLCVHHLAANKTEKSIERIGKSISPIYEALCAFDDENLISNASGKHSVPSRKDQNEIIKELLQNDIFEFKPGREQAFQRLLLQHYEKCRLLENYNMDERTL